MSLLELSIYLVAALAYFIPFYIARYRHVNGLQLIFWFNLFFAWTFFAWCILIIASLSLRANERHNHSLIA